ncbi:MAG: carbamoyltransferase HypF [Candidatus Helarchaeota archaeon]
MIKRAILNIQGIVQGVGFRPFINVLANSFSLSGIVLNLGNAGVRVEVEGEENVINKFIKRIKIDKPKISSIDKIDVKWSNKLKNYTNFIILKSVDEKGESLVLPPDISICDDCLKEFNDEKNERYYNYPFIACTHCGPRFTSVIDLPYDRPRTTMNDFPFCQDCLKEYTTLGDRRFHAQTFACKRCGPKYFLIDNRRNKIETDNPIQLAMKLLEEGHIIAIKGIGGIHIACKASSNDIVKKLRDKKKRKAKPFAIMVSNIKKLKTFSDPTEFEIKELISYQRPIVLVKKSNTYYLSELIAPGLDTIGVFLPYSGIHYLMFKYLNEVAIVLTSANKSDEPMIISNEIALKKLCNIADYFLLHNREIYQRADDTVLLINQNYPTFIRRSRGYVPQWVNIPFNSNEVIVALGPEERNTGCILKKGRAYFTQHIGNLTNLDQFNFEINAIQHLMKLTRTEDAKIYACDLHPQFLSTRLAFELAERHSGIAIQVQHHFAHASSLIADQNITTPMICITCDGYGYGIDGSAWGGEIILASLNNFKRIGHLEPQFMPGGDLCTKYPVRMLASILSKFLSSIELKKFYSQGYKSYLRYNEKELDIIITQLQKRINLPITSSCGRVLDAISSLLNICHIRTFEGEPAMKLESVARKINENYPKFLPEIQSVNSLLVLKTTPLFEYLIDLMNKGYKRTALANLAHNYLGKGLSSIAIQKAHDLGIDKIGFSGGVAFNTIITKIIRDEVTKNGLKFVQHRNVSPGDGGISIGQALLAASKYD